MRSTRLRLAAVLLTTAIAVPGCAADAAQKPTGPDITFCLDAAGKANTSWVAWPAKDSKVVRLKVRVVGQSSQAGRQMKLGKTEFALLSDGEKTIADTLANFGVGRHPLLLDNQETGGLLDVQSPKRAPLVNGDPKRHTC